MIESCEREVIELHRFFVAWMTGALPPDDTVFARVAGVLAEGFLLISPRGVIAERGALLQELSAAHGRRADTGFAIDAHEFRPRHRHGELLLATYEEWTREADAHYGRLSTAAFARQPGTPNGVVWLQVHETWLPGHAG